jgi:hypothetical protein
MTSSKTEKSAAWKKGRTTIAKKLLSQEKQNGRERKHKNAFENANIVNVRERFCFVSEESQRRSRRNRSIHFLESWQCTSGVSAAHKSRIQEDRVLRLSISIRCNLIKETKKLTIEASVTTRQTILAAEITMNVELGKAIHALKLLEAVEWNLGSAGDELQKLGLFFLVEAANSTPEPLDLWRGLLVVMVFGVVLPVIDVNIGQT